MSWMTEQEARDLAAEIGAVPDIEDVHIVYKPPTQYSCHRPPCWAVKCTYVGPTKYWNNDIIEAGKQFEVWHKKGWQDQRILWA